MIFFFALNKSLQGHKLLNNASRVISRNGLRAPRQARLVQTSHHFCGTNNCLYFKLQIALSSYNKNKTRNVVA